MRFPRSISFFFHFSFNFNTATGPTYTMGGVASIPVNPRQRPEVICIGYQRTGTLSMALALEKLGYGPVAHGGSQLVGRDDGTSHLHFHHSPDADNSSSFLTPSNPLFRIHAQVISRLPGPR